MLDKLFHIALRTKPEGKTNKSTVDPVVFGLTDPLSAAVTARGFLSGEAG